MPAGATIFALSSGAPPAAIAIVRVSGPFAGAALSSIAGPLPSPRRAAVRDLRAPDGELLDRALILWFPGPATATGEDLAELHLHGGRATVAAIVSMLAGLPGMRLAEPGEFTRRAFENGRIDLLQAEGLADLLAAETAGQRRNALRFAEGGLGALIERWRQTILDIAAHVEAEIEFAEDEPDVTHDTAITAKLITLRTAIADALDIAPAERLRDGARIILAGPVNSGKSALINAIVGRSVALATPIAGTTRDLIEAPVIIDGMAAILIDSAGLRPEAIDPVERMGIDRAQAAIESADLILWLGSLDECPRGNVLTVAARCDIVDYDDVRDITVSAITGDGMAELRSMLSTRLAELQPSPDRIALAKRHRTILHIIARDLDETITASDPVIIAAGLERVRRGFNDLTGRAGVEDMLDTLFGRFCIGK